MKYAMMLFLFVFALDIFVATPPAEASEGALVGSMHYMDDSKADTKVSPFLGLKVKEDLSQLIQNMSGQMLVGGGYVDQVDGSDVSETYARFAADLIYTVNDGLKFGLGGGFESSKDTYRSFDDYVHLKAEYKIW